VRGTGSDANEILNGKEKGKNLYEWFLENRARWGLEQYEEFPVSIALVDARESLSVQVHPSSAIAGKYEARAVGKNESFYLLEEPESGTMINGCRCSSKEELRNCVKEERWEDIIDRLPVKKGDYVYVAEGTLHAMTKGALTYEIEENCNYTYRLYDYGRLDHNGKKRKLDLEKAIDSIDVSKKSFTQTYGEEEIEEKHYATQLLREKKQYTNRSDSLVCITVIDGGGMADHVELQPGMSVLLEPGESLTAVRLKLAMAAKIRL